MPTTYEERKALVEQASDVYRRLHALRTCDNDLGLSPQQREEFARLLVEEQRLDQLLLAACRERDAEELG